MDSDTIQHSSGQKAGHGPMFRKIGLLYIPVSFNGWLLLIATVAMCFHAPRQSGTESPPVLLAMVLSLPPLFLYYWIARRCFGVACPAVNIPAK